MDCHFSLGVWTPLQLNYLLFSLLVMKTGAKITSATKKTKRYSVFVLSFFILT